MRYARDTIILKTVQGHSDPKNDTPSSQDVFTHQSWNSYLKEYDCTRLNAVSRNCQVQGHSDPIMVRDTSTSQDASTTKFEIPTSNNIRDMLWTRFF